MSALCIDADNQQPSPERPDSPMLGIELLNVADALRQRFDELFAKTRELDNWLESSGRELEKRIDRIKAKYEQLVAQKNMYKLLF